MVRDVNRWFEEHRWAGDALLAGTLLVVLGVASVGVTAVTGRSYDAVWGALTPDADAPSVMAAANRLVADALPRPGCPRCPAAPRRALQAGIRGRR